MHAPGARRLLGLLVPALLIAAGCATPAQVDFDPEARFDRFRTWAWLQDESQMAEALGSDVDPLLLRRLRTAIGNELVGKGYSQVEERDAADFVVSFTLGSRETLPQGQFSLGTGWSGRYGGWHASVPVIAQSHTEGTLAIDLFDGHTQQAVWHGSTSLSLEPSEDRETLVNDAVGAILAKFPPER